MYSFPHIFFVGDGIIPCTSFFQVAHACTLANLIDCSDCLIQSVFFIKRFSVKQPYISETDQREVAMTTQTFYITAFLGFIVFFINIISCISLIVPHISIVSSTIQIWPSEDFILHGFSTIPVWAVAVGA